MLGYSRLIWTRFVVHQDLRSVLRCQIAAFEAIGGAPREILHDRMKTAVIGEDPDGRVIYNCALLDLARHYGFQPRACRPYRPKTKGKVERPFRYIREDFFLGASFRNLDDLNAQLRHWLANPRVHATTQRVVNEAFTEEKPALKPLPLAPYRTVLKLERRLSHEGMVSVSDTTRRRVLDVQVFADEIRIFEDGALIATHAPPEGRDQKHLDPAHRKALPLWHRRRADGDRVIRRTATRSRDARSTSTMPSHGISPAREVLRDERPSRDCPHARRPHQADPGRPEDAPRAIEMLDVTVRRLERGEMTAIEAIDVLLAEELTLLRTAASRSR